MITMGHRHPITGNETLVEVGRYESDPVEGYWAQEIDPVTLEPRGGCFFAPMSELF